MSRYYEDLSGDSSSGGESSDEGSATSFARAEESSSDLAVPFQIVLHLDVDCFYGQCEHLDRSIPVDRPLAIGQKHIIVTANYAARSYGVKKLESRDSAKSKCPHLLIVEGSDLQNYRKHARKIYESFRKACKRIHTNVTVCKGSGMDEMFADLGSAVGGEQDHEEQDDYSSIPCYIYRGETMVMTEDQSGTQSVAAGRDLCYDHDVSGRKDSGWTRRLDLTRSLHRAAHLAAGIRQGVLQETNFTTTIGISISPLAAKLASGLKKPHTVNVLYPWLVKPLVADMPLRKIPGIGHRTMKALDQCLMENLPAKQLSVWTCGDLLKLPRDAIVECLRRIPSFERSATAQCDSIIQKCQGLDNSRIVDDQGGIPKTVSVENSFRRGTLVTRQAVSDAMEDLYERLPRLLRDRSLWSEAPELAFPSTIRLTVRSLNTRSASNMKRPFMTRSKQASFRGQALLEDKDHTQLLRRLIAPLLECLVFCRDVDINITRINVAVTGFSDIPSCSTGGQDMLSFLNSSPSESKSGREILKQKAKHISPSVRTSRIPKGQPLSATDDALFVAKKIDPSILDELPADIAAEVRRTHRVVQETKRKRIDQFFPRKRASG